MLALPPPTSAAFLVPLHHRILIWRIVMSFPGYHLALNLKRYMLRKLHPAFPSERRPPRADALPQRLGRLGSAIVSLKLPPLFPLSFSCQATPTANREVAMARKQRPRQNRAEATKRWTPSPSRMGDWPNQYTQGGGHQGRTPSRSGKEDWEEKQPTPERSCRRRTSMPHRESTRLRPG